MSISANYKKYLNKKATESHMKETMGVSHLNKNLMSVFSASNQRSSFGNRNYSVSQNDIAIFEGLQNDIESLINEVNELKNRSSRLEDEIRQITALNLSGQMKTTFLTPNNEPNSNELNDEQLEQWTNELEALRTYKNSLVSILYPKELSLLRQEIDIQKSYIKQLNDFCQLAQADIDTIYQRNLEITSAPVFSNIMEQDQIISQLKENVKTAVEEHRRLKAEMITIKSDEQDPNSLLEELEHQNKIAQQKLEEKLVELDSLESVQQNEISTFARSFLNKDKNKSSHSSPKTRDLKNQNSKSKTNRSPKDDNSPRLKKKKRWIQPNDSTFFSSYDSTEHQELISDSNGVSESQKTKDNRTTIRVGYFKKKVSKNGLMKYVSPFGSVDECVIEKDLKSQYPRYYGIVRYQNHKSAAKAIKNLNGQQVRGGRFHVDWDINPEYESELEAQGLYSESSITPTNEIKVPLMVSIESGASDLDEPINQQQNAQNTKEIKEKRKQVCYFFSSSDSEDQKHNEELNDNQHLSENSHTSALSSSSDKTNQQEKELPSNQKNQSPNKPIDDPNKFVDVATQLSEEEDRNEQQEEHSMKSSSSTSIMNIYSSTTEVSQLSKENSQKTSKKEHKDDSYSSTEITNTDLHTKNKTKEQTSSLHLDNSNEYGENISSELISSSSSRRSRENTRKRLKIYPISSFDFNQSESDSQKRKNSNDSTHTKKNKKSSSSSSSSSKPTKEEKKSTNESNSVQDLESDQHRIEKMSISEENKSNSSRSKIKKEKDKKPLALFYDQSSESESVPLTLEMTSESQSSASLSVNSALSKSVASTVQQDPTSARSYCVKNDMNKKSPRGFNAKLYATDEPQDATSHQKVLNELLVMESDNNNEQVKIQMKVESSDSYKVYSDSSSSSDSKIMTASANEKIVTPITQRNETKENPPLSANEEVKQYGSEHHSKKTESEEEIIKSESGEDQNPSEIVRNDSEEHETNEVKDAQEDHPKEDDNRNKEDNIGLNDDQVGSGIISGEEKEMQNEIESTKSQSNDEKEDNIITPSSQSEVIHSDSHNSEPKVITPLAGDNAIISSVDKDNDKENHDKSLSDKDEPLATKEEDKEPPQEHPDKADKSEPLNHKEDDTEDINGDSNNEKSLNDNIEPSKDKEENNRQNKEHSDNDNPLSNQMNSFINSLINPEGNKEETNVNSSNEKSLSDNAEPLIDQEDHPELTQEHTNNEKPLSDKDQSSLDTTNESSQEHSAKPHSDQGEPLIHKEADNEPTQEDSNNKKSLSDKDQPSLDKENNTAKEHFDKLSDKGEPLIHKEDDHELPQKESNSDRLPSDKGDTSLDKENNEEETKEPSNKSLLDKDEHLIPKEDDKGSTQEHSDESDKDEPLITKDDSEEIKGDSNNEKSLNDKAETSLNKENNEEENHDHSDKSLSDKAEPLIHKEDDQKETQENLNYDESLSDKGEKIPDKIGNSDHSQDDKSQPDQKEEQENNIEGNDQPEKPESSRHHIRYQRSFSENELLGKKIEQISQRIVYQNSGDISQITPDAPQNNELIEKPQSSEESVKMDISQSEPSGKESVDHNSTGEQSIEKESDTVEQQPDSDKKEDSEHTDNSQKSEQPTQPPLNIEIIEEEESNSSKDDKSQHDEKVEVPTNKKDQSVEESSNNSSRLFGEGESESPYNENVTPIKQESQNKIKYYASLDRDLTNNSSSSIPFGSGDDDDNLPNQITTSNNILNQVIQKSINSLLPVSDGNLQNAVQPTENVNNETQLTDKTSNPNQNNGPLLNFPQYLMKSTPPNAQQNSLPWVKYQQTPFAAKTGFAESQRTTNPEQKRFPNDTNRMAKRSSSASDSDNYFQD